MKSRIIGKDSCNHLENKRVQERPISGSGPFARTRGHPNAVDAAGEPKERITMIRRLLVLSFSLLSVMSSGSALAAGISYPEAPGPNPDHLITPPQENPYFYVRPDGQAFTLQVDSTNNMTDYLNRHYYDFAWRGEQWGPWDMLSNSEKAVRGLHLWPEYNEANQFHLFNGVNRFFERYSGFGPGPAKGGLP